jgi:hypothetical protein
VRALVDQGHLDLVAGGEPGDDEVPHLPGRGQLVGVRVPQADVRRRQFGGGHADALVDHVDHDPTAVAGAADDHDVAARR